MDGTETLEKLFLKYVIAAPLLHACFDSGYIPQLWTKSIILTIFKKGDTNVPGNYKGTYFTSQCGQQSFHMHS